MIWKTKLTQLLKIQYPLIMGAFGGWGKCDFASPFSEAGGLGMITALNFPKIEDFKSDIRKMKDLTDKPFGINLSLPHHALGGMKSEEEIQDRYLSYIEASLSEDCNIFTTSGYRAPFIAKKVKESGGIWIHKCTLLHHALSAEKEGADAITILGIEGTGFKHPASNSTLVNLTMAKKVLKIPIIAAGGIGDARGFVGAIALGADGVCLGTALMATEECPVPNRVKERWIKTNIYSEDFHHKIYTYNTKNFMAPSTAIAHRKIIISIKDLFDEIISESEKIVNSWGFNNEEFSTLDS